MRFLLSPLFLFLCFACGTTSPLSTGSDPGYNQLIATAEREEAAGNFQSAAENYREAYTLRPNRPEIAFKAAELFTRIRDYEAAAASYAVLPGDDTRWPLLGLRYGRSLKQSGRSQEAERVLSDFQAGYNGSDRGIVSEIVNNELQGLAMARTEDNDQRYEVINVGRGINSGGNELGPSLMGTDRVLFTSTQGGQNRLLSSQQSGIEWQRAAAPGGFPVISGGQFGTGVFSEDGQAYFFTICSGTSADAVEINRCEIFRTGRRLSGAWMQPERVSPNVNLAATNNAFPSAVTMEDGRQILYFASNRPGGRGGMDIYRAIQTDINNKTAFDEPVLLGNAVNTAGDEVTPAFDRANQALYFASNGHPGLGGFDLFRAQRVNGVYERSINMGAPVNSSADDQGLTVPGTAGYSLMSSNRRSLPEKTGTTDDDIFQVGLGANTPVLRASAFDEGTRRVVSGVEVTLLEILPGRQEKEVVRQRFTESTYVLPLMPGRGYHVILRHPAYQAAEYRVQTDATGSSIYGRPIYLRSNGKPNTNSGNSGTTGGTTNPGSSDPDLAPAAAPPTAYRIQISATREFDPNETLYAEVKKVAELRSEAIPGRDLKRITVGYYQDIESARGALSRVQSAGFDDAFIVRYDFGKRYGRIK